jgi:hypothetical protein
VVPAQETAKTCTAELLVNACATGPAGKTPGKVPSKARAGHRGKRGRHKVLGKQFADNVEVAAVCCHFSVFTVPGGGGPLARHAVALIRTTIAFATVTCLHEQRASLAPHHISPNCCHHHSTTLRLLKPRFFTAAAFTCRSARHSPSSQRMRSSGKSTIASLDASNPSARPHQPAHNHALTDGSTPSPSPSSSSTSSPEPPAAGPSSLAEVWRDFSLAISRDPAAQRFRKSHTQPARRYHSSAAITHGLMIRSDSPQPAISRHSSRFSHMRSVAPAPL